MEIKTFNTQQIEYIDAVEEYKTSLGSVHLLAEMPLFIDRDSEPLLLQHFLFKRKYTNHLMDMPDPQDPAEMELIEFQVPDSEKFFIVRNFQGDLIDKNSPLYLRLHSSCITSEVFGSRACDCKFQLDQSIEFLGNSTSPSILIYLPDHEG